MKPKTAALLIADAAEKITADLPVSQKLDAIKAAIEELREMHEVVSHKAATAAVLLSAEYMEVTK